MEARLGGPTPPLVRTLAEQAVSRAAGAPLVPGNSVRILKDAAEHYAAWHEAIRSATRTIYFENYIVADDAVGRELAAALAAAARSGVRVRVICDWFGSLGAGSDMWQPLVAAGGEVRRFNPPQFDSPFGWLARDHRKAVAVDGRVAFATGVCASRKWLGDPARGIAPWRDTGVEVRGPAVADIERSFAETWAVSGAPIPAGELTPAGSIAPAGEVMVRVLGAAPSVAALYRLDQLIAVMAHRTLWLTDAYFVGVSPYVQALRAAAIDGVDVRLLVPGASDLPVLSPISRAGYRPLLDAGVRVFEWNGPMLHAKTAVADGRWARVGSSNLNIASWMSNYELDIVVEDRQFAAAMESMYVDDLANATEIVLSGRNRVRLASPRQRRRSHGGSASRAAAGALRLSNTVGAAITRHRVLGPAETGTMTGLAVAMLAAAALSLTWPWLVAVPVALLAVWLAAALLMQAHRLRAAASRAENANGEAAPDAEDQPPPP